MLHLTIRKSQNTPDLLALVLLPDKEIFEIQIPENNGTGFSAIRCVGYLFVGSSGVSTPYGQGRVGSAPHRYYSPPNGVP